jgi:hypothetical protein
VIYELNRMAPEQIDTLETFLFVLFWLVSIPFAWLYSEKRGRDPWVWAAMAALISWIAVLCLRLLPDKSKPPAAPFVKSVDEQPQREGISERAEQIQAEQILHDLRAKPR